MAGSAYLLAVGIDIEGDSEVDIEAVRTPYVAIHVPEVVETNQGMIRSTSYELVEYDDELAIGPRWMTYYEFADNASAEDYITRVKSATPPTYGTWSDVETSLTWRVMWRLVPPYEGPMHQGDFIYLSGQGPPPGTDAAEEQAYSDFYTKYHVPELVGCCGFTGGTRYKVHEDFTEAHAESPKYLAMYDALSTSIRPATDVTMSKPRGTYIVRDDFIPPLPENGFTVGPYSWENRDVKWRLSYKKIGTHVASSVQ